MGKTLIIIEALLRESLVFRVWLVAAALLEAQQTADRCSLPAD